MDVEQQLTNQQLFALWADGDIASWERVVGVSLTHLSRGVGRVTSVSQTAGEVSIHVQYFRAQREHPLWEFRTEFIRMTLPDGLTREEMIPVVKARRLRREEIKRLSLRPVV